MSRLYSLMVSALRGGGADSWRRGGDNIGVLLRFRRQSLFHFGERQRVELQIHFQSSHLTFKIGLQLVETISDCLDCPQAK